MKIMFPSNVSAVTHGGSGSRRRCVGAGVGVDSGRMFLLGSISLLLLISSSSSLLLEPSASRRVVIGFQPRGNIPTIRSTTTTTLSMKGSTSGGSGGGTPSSGGNPRRSRRRQGRRRSTGGSTGGGGGEEQLTELDLQAEASMTGLDSYTSSSSSSSSSPFLTLEDDSGHINRELAEHLWTWEQDHRRSQQKVSDTNKILPSYSTRQGLRLVNDIVTELLTGGQTQQGQPKQQTQRRRLPPGQERQYDDLVQEGIVSLMQAMTTYHEEHDVTNLPKQSGHGNHLLQDDHHAFEEYARNIITEQLLKMIKENENGGGFPSLPEKSKSPSKPQKFLSMESTVGIADPVEETHYYYSNLDEWEIQSGLVLDNGRPEQHSSSFDDEDEDDEDGQQQSVQDRNRLQQRRQDNDDDDNSRPLVEEYLDETLQHEGEDEMWIEQQRVAAPLRDFIPDEEQQRSTEDDINNTNQNNGNDGENDTFLFLSSPDEVAIRDMIRFNVDAFLGNTTLDETERQIIQLRFGLASTTTPTTMPSSSSSTTSAYTSSQVAKKLGLSVLQVETLQQSALKKLRRVYADKYFGGIMDEEDYDAYDSLTEDYPYFWQQEDSV